MRRVWPWVLVAGGVLMVAIGAAQVPSPRSSCSVVGLSRSSWWPRRGWTGGAGRPWPLARPDVVDRAAGSGRSARDRGLGARCPVARRVPVLTPLPKPAPLARDRSHARYRCRRPTGATLRAAGAGLGFRRKVGWRWRRPRAVPPDRRPTPAGRRGGEGGHHAIAGGSALSCPQPWDRRTVEAWARCGSPSREGTCDDRAPATQAAGPRADGAHRRDLQHRPPPRARPGRRPAAGRPGWSPGTSPFGGGPHRSSSLVAHLLRRPGTSAPHTGEPYTEAMVCGLGGGIGFMYAIFEYKGLPPLITIVAQHHPEPWLPAVLGRLGVAATEGHSTAPAPAHGGAARRRSTGARPVWCVVDRVPACPGTPGERACRPTRTRSWWPAPTATRSTSTTCGPAPHPIAEARLRGGVVRGTRKGRHHRVTLDRPGRAGRPAGGGAVRARPPRPRT